MPLQILVPPGFTEQSTIHSPSLVSTPQLNHVCNRPPLPRCALCLSCAIAIILTLLSREALSIILSENNYICRFHWCSHQCARGPPCTLRAPCSHCRSQQLWRILVAGEKSSGSDRRICRVSTLLSCTPCGQNSCQRHLIFRVCCAAASTEMRTLLLVGMVSCNVLAAASMARNAALDVATIIGPLPRRWFAPSNIAVSAFDGQSLFGAFTASIGEQLAHFPTGKRTAIHAVPMCLGLLSMPLDSPPPPPLLPAGPAVTDKFWLLLVTWHLGLFVTLTLAQIGVQGRKQVRASRQQSLHVLLHVYAGNIPRDLNIASGKIKGSCWAQGYF